MQSFIAYVGNVIGNEKLFIKHTTHMKTVGTESAGIGRRVGKERKGSDDFALRLP